MCVHICIVVFVMLQTNRSREWQCQKEETRHGDLGPKVLGASSALCCSVAIAGLAEGA
jgi:hypothetical protein